MDSKLRLCQKLEIPDALMSDHDVLRERLMRATTVPGRIGIAAERASQFWLLHFAEEEEEVFRAIELLKELEQAGEQGEQPTTLFPIIARISAKHLAMRDRHHPIHATLEELQQVARDEGNDIICELVDDLRKHEQIEDQVMYPTLMFADASARGKL